MGNIKAVGHLRKIIRKVFAFQKENDESHFGSYHRYNNFGFD